VQAAIGAVIMRDRQRMAAEPVRPASIDVFVAHAVEDSAFVEGFLIKALGVPADKVLLSSRLEPGAIIVDEIERGVRSPTTLAVLSAAFMRSPWARFAERLAQHRSLLPDDATTSAIVPVLLENCQPSLLSAVRVPLDFRVPSQAHWEAEAARLRDRLGTSDPGVIPRDCPFPGTRPFTEADATRFHGRRRELDNILARLRAGEREVYVVGPLGSGKSSLVAAGLIPTLGTAPQLGGDHFTTCTIRPGADPIGELRKAILAPLPGAEGDLQTRDGVRGAIDRALDAHRGSDRLLLFIDQLDEIFTSASREARGRFGAALDHLRADTRVTLVLTVRAEHWSAVLDSPLWPGGSASTSRIDLTTPRRDDLRDAIVTPAITSGVHCEPALVARLIQDASGSPSPLPWLQDTLVTLWHRRARDLLRLHDYAARSAVDHGAAANDPELDGATPPPGSAVSVASPLVSPPRGPRDPWNRRIQHSDTLLIAVPLVAIALLIILRSC
jgi:hypothetical protein